jgi:hypothetical protein
MALDHQALGMRGISPRGKRAGRPMFPERSHLLRFRPEGPYRLSQHSESFLATASATCFTRGSSSMLA